jgi:hypothetical protein
MANLFISYARVDGKELAERLEADLRARNHEPWRDRSEIEGGDDWSREIEGEIDGCDALVAVLTQGANDSDICRCEQFRALRQKKRVVPLLAQKNAPLPLYLELTHYLDFTDPGNYASGFEELLDSILHGKGVSIDDLLQRDRERLPQEVPVRSMAAALRRRQASWDEVCAMADAQRARFIEGLSPRRGTVGIFEPALYVRRAAEEGELDDFVGDDARALLLIGNMGVGKTNLLCHWCGEQAEKGQAILMYACDRLATADVEGELVKDFGLGDPAALSPTLAYLDELAGRHGRRVIIVYDAVNDFRSRNGDGHKQLLTCIDSLVSRLPGTNVRVVLTSSTAAWNRLERLGPPTLTWARYHRTRRDDEMVVLGAFDDKEAAAAFECYRKHFNLPFALSDLSPALTARLREPLLLRLLADTFRPTPDRRDVPPPDTLIFRRYYEERVRRPVDQQFIETLAEEMFSRNEAALPIRTLVDHPRLGSAISSEADSSYIRLLDQGVLLEVRGDLFNDDVLKFTYPLVGAYALARTLTQRKESIQVTLRMLMDRVGTFPLAWDAAVTFLVMKGVLEKGALDVYAEFAGAPDAAMRELASDSLVRLHEVNRERALQVLDALLNGDSPQQQRTALRAAFTIGPAARDLLLRGAMSASPSLRRAVRDTLYLVWTGASGLPRERSPGMLYFVWRHAPGFAHGLVQDLLARVSLVRPLEAARILQFVLDWCVTMYINHCEREEVAQQTAELFYDLTVKRLHLDRVLHPQIDRLVANAVAAVVSRPLLEWMLQMTEEEAARFFRIPAHERKVLAESAPVLDPGADVVAAEPLIRRMLGSRIDVYCGTAALALAVHAYANFGRSEAMLRRMFKDLDAHGRVWQMMAFAVLLPETPGSWIPLLEDMTRSLLEAQPEVALGGNGSPKVADLVLVPLGLAYGKQSRGMPLFAELLADTSSKGQDRRRRLVMLLSPVGFYYPHVVLDTLKPYLGAPVQRNDLRDALVKALATMRTLHFDLVDSFMDQAGADESFRRQVEASTDVSLIDGFMSKLGFFNNAVHQCLCYPRMRRGLVMFPLQKLVELDSVRRFIAVYAGQFIRMARDARFQLLKWTEPD